MSHTTQGNETREQIWFGENLEVQRITVNGSPASGSILFSYLDGRVRQPVSRNATAEEVEASLRTLPFIEDVSVTGPVGGPWDVTAGADASLVELIVPTGTFTGGTNPEVTCEALNRFPLLWPILQADGYTESSVQPTVPKTANPAENTDHAIQTRAQEVLGLRNQKGGLGRLHLKEIDEFGRIWDSECLTHLDDQILLPPAIQTMDIGPDLTPNPQATGTSGIGVTANGPRLIAVWDTLGNNGSSEVVYLDVVNQKWVKLPIASGVWTSLTPRLPITYYEGYAYIGWAESLHEGYLTWDGLAANNALRRDTTDLSRVMDWCEWDGKLFRLQANGKIAYTVAAPAALETDWVNVGKYRGIGYAYALEVFALQDGKAAVHVIATDGIYYVAFDNQQSTMSIQRLHTINGSIIPPGGRIPYPDSVGVADGNLWITTAERIVNRWDGSALRPVGPDTDDGLPTQALGINTRVRVRGLLGLQHYLLAFCSGQSLGGAAYTTTATLNVNTLTTYYDTLNAEHDVIAEADVYIEDPVDDQCLVLLYNKQGWHVLVPIRQPAFTGGLGSRSGVYHELFGEPRLEIAPAKYVTFHDSPSNPREWEGMKFDTTTTRYVTASWQDAGVPDIDKLAFRDEFGYADCGNGATLTPYYQIDDAHDRAELVVGNDPAVYWVAHKDEDGNPIVIGDGDELPHGRLWAYFERETSNYGVFSRGLRYRQFRQTVGLTSNNPDVSPILQYVSTPQVPKFNALENYPSMAVDLTKEIDGRSAWRMRTDAKQLYRSKYVHPFSGIPGLPSMVSMEFFQLHAASTGATLTDGAEPILELFLGEWTRT